MKNILFIFFIILSYAQFSQAQTPNSFSYQAVVRDASGITTNNQTVAFRISILQTTATGTSVYSETHAAATNDFGLVNLEIGAGTILSGNMNTIDWSNDDYFVQVDLDATGGNNYSTMGTTQLLSVPFAMHAATSGDNVWDKLGTDVVYDDGNVGIGTTTPSTKLHVTQTATSSQEELARFQVADASDDNLAIVNATLSNGTFIPSIRATRTSDSREVVFLSAKTTTTNDNGTDPLMAFAAGNQTSHVTTRPLFQWKNYTTNHMTMAANGNLGIGTTTPARKLHVTEAMRLQPITYSTALSNPSAGDMYFSSTTNKLMVYDGSTWQACW